MTQLIGSEYLLACFFIMKAKAGIKNTTFEEFLCLCRKLEKISVEKNMDIVFLVSRYQICDALKEHSIYFKVKKGSNERIEEISLNDGIEPIDLECRFIGYLPEYVYCLIQESLN